jgi:hypothetical protein
MDEPAVLASLKRARVESVDDDFEGDFNPEQGQAPAQGTAGEISRNLVLTLLEKVPRNVFVL